MISTIPGISLSTQAYIIVALLGATLGEYLILIYAMMGNVVDYDELLTNRRRAAIYYGTFSLRNWTWYCSWNLAAARTT